ncbi:unnamed protein product [Schistocephalus solidus]|uniref:KIF-binding protein n=1 Tax=Schistocephalus solidus TaxID=70667 RepID=A0A183S960_SCHSO|nr:unnamed protein product [Schistocephalus solidus]
MQKRRTDILESLLDRLNPQHYMALRRQIMFDLADALSIHSALKIQKTGVSLHRVLTTASGVNSARPSCRNIQIQTIASLTT